MTTETTKTHDEAQLWQFIADPMSVICAKKNTGTLQVTTIPAEKFVYTAGSRTNEHSAVAQCHARWGSHHFAQGPL